MSELHSKVLRKLEARIAKLKHNGKAKEADKVERFLNEYLLPSNFRMYPFGPEGTVAYRKSMEKEK